MTNGYLLILIFALGGFGFVGFIFLISRILQTQKPNPEKLSPYECGEEGFPSGIVSFPFRYYLPAVIFLLFEVELVLMAPVILSKNKIPQDWDPYFWHQMVRWESLFFFFILVLGFVLAISARYLDWEKPEIPAPIFKSPVPDFAYEQFNLEQMKTESSRKEKNNSGNPGSGTLTT